MTGKGGPAFAADAWRSSPSWISRCCHSPTPDGPTRATSARHDPTCCSSQGCQGWPAGEAVAVEEGAEARFLEARPQRLRGGRVRPGVAEKDVVSLAVAHEATIYS